MARKVFILQCCETEPHTYTFDVPLGADLLVTVEASRNQMFRKGRAVGVIFHPDVTAETVGRYARVRG